MSEPLKEKQVWPWWRRIVLILVLMSMVLLAALVSAGYVVERQLGAEVIKISQSGEPLTFSDLAAALKPAGTVDDAADSYGLALSDVTADDLEKLARANVFYRMKINTKGVGEFSAEQREELASVLAGFQTTLKNLDRGADIALFDPVISVEKGIEVCVDRLRRARTAATSLSTRTLKLILDGEGDAAADSAVNMLKMTRIFDHQPIIVVHTIKIGVLDLACKDIHLLLRFGRPSGQSLARLQEALSETIPANALEEMFLTERVYQIEMARNLLTENIVSQYLQADVPDFPERLRLPGSFRVRLRMRQKAIRYFRDMTRLITAVRRPWPGPLDATAGSLPEPAKRFRRLFSSGAAFIRLTAGTIVGVRCTVLAIAIERYRRSHGELPHSLDDLSGDYIDSIPLDPFTGKNLLYGRDKESYVVYSVGPDRQDDGGFVKPRAGEKGPRDLGLRFLFLESK